MKLRIKLLSLCRRQRYSDLRNIEEKNGVAALSIHETGSSSMALSPSVSNDDSIIIQPFLLPPLPEPQWDLIIKFIFAEHEIWDVHMALIQVCNLSLLCRSTRDACRRFPFKLDASRSLDAHIRALSRAHISVSSLNLDSFTNREYLLRFPNFIEHSSQSLVDLTANVKYIDTLVNFTQLQTFTLCVHEGRLNRRPAVLNGLWNLKELKLSGFETFTTLSDIPFTGFMNSLGKEMLNGLDVLILKPVISKFGLVELNSAAPLPARLKKVAIEWEGDAGGGQLNKISNLVLVVYIRPLLNAVDDIILLSGCTKFLFEEGDELDSAEKFVLLMISTTKWSRLEFIICSPSDDSPSPSPFTICGIQPVKFSMKDIVSELERILVIDRVLEWEHSVAETEYSHRRESLVLHRRR